MDKKLTITEEYLYLPICVGAEETLVEIFAGPAADKEGNGSFQKVFEFQVPVDPEGTGAYECDYYAEVPVAAYLGRELAIRAKAP